MRSIPLCTVLLSSFLAAPQVRADDPPPPPPPPVDVGPLAPAGFASVDCAREFGNKARVERIATSREGRPIQAVILGGKDPKQKLPALLIVGGLDGESLVSTDQAIGAVRALLKDENAKLLESVRIYAVPELNPDARAAAFASRHPRLTTMRQVDDDHDGTVDEDGPRDLNGDGVISMMRRVAPPGRTATHVVDAADPRIVRPANKEKHEVATHEVLVEGADSDGDGLMAEDPAGGVALDRNFPHRWQEFASDAGPYQLSEPEALGLARFVREHPEITTAVVFGRHDTLVHFPDTKDKDFTGRTPVVYHEADHVLYREFGRIWKESTKLEKSEQADLAGSLVLWLADHRGIAAVAANGWSRPEPPKLPEGAPAPAETGDGEQAAWLAVSDRMYGGRGFVAWKEFAHPTLGTVEIGGFAPFFRESPTAVQATELVGKSSAFIVAVASKRAEIEVGEPVLTPLADGLARIDMRVTNKGPMPTVTEMGRIAGVVPPIVVRVPVKPEQMLQGRPVEKIDRLEAGASRDYSWIVRMPANGALDLTVSGPTFDTITRSVKAGAK